MPIERIETHTQTQTQFLSQPASLQALNRIIQPKVTVACMLVPNKEH